MPCPALPCSFVLHFCQQTLFLYSQTSLRKVTCCFDASSIIYQSERTFRVKLAADRISVITWIVRFTFDWLISKWRVRLEWALRNREIASLSRLFVLFWSSLTSRMILEIFTSFYEDCIKSHCTPKVRLTDVRETRGRASSIRHFVGHSWWEKESKFLSLTFFNYQAWQRQARMLQWTFITA